MCALPKKEKRVAWCHKIAVSVRRQWQCRWQAQHAAFSPVLKVQAVCAALLFCLVLLCYHCYPAGFALLQGQYQNLFEGSDYTPSVLRFVQQVAASAAIQADAADAPVGSSLVMYQASEAWVCPVEDYEISSGYGWRDDPFTGALSFHSGVDFACAEGQAVVAVQDGVIERNYLSDSYGYCILIRHADGSITLYAHLQYAFARQGEWVSAGEQIGTVGQTGAATGTHLHFEVIVNNEKQDPSAALGL